MKSKSLKQANAYLRPDNAATRAMLVRCVASSTAVETGESISVIEKRLRDKGRLRSRVKPGG